jgi:hypothetical protein
MQFLAIVLVVIGFLLFAASALKAEWIIDKILSYSARVHGTSSWVFRMQNRVMNNSFYIASFRIIAGINAILVLALIIYNLFGSQQ